jgi:hypothetical protein
MTAGEIRGDIFDALWIETVHKILHDAVHCVKVILHFTIVIEFSGQPGSRMNFRNEVCCAG